MQKLCFYELLPFGLSRKLTKMPKASEKEVKLKLNRTFIINGHEKTSRTCVEVNIKVV